MANYNETIVGTDENDYIVSGGGNDSIDGLAGDDVIKAGAGNNTVIGGEGNDTITTGAGDDSIIGGAGADVINAGAGDNTMLGGVGNDVITTGAGNDDIDGGAGDDVINAGAGDNTVVGGIGNDTITVGNGFNEIDGGVGNDLINTNKGDDTVNFTDYFGNDTVKAGSDEILNLNVENEYKKEIIGNDVKLTVESGTSYYATVTVDKDYVIDGHVKDGENFVHISILDKLTDVTYKLNADPATTITKDEYDALTPEEQADYSFNQGTLKLTLQTGLGHSDGSYGIMGFSSDTLYRISDYPGYDWSDLGEYSSIEHDAVSAILANSDAVEAYDGAYLFSVTNFSNFEVHKLVDDVEEAFDTEEYINSIRNAADYAVNQGMYDEQTAGTILLKDFVTKGADAIVTVNGTDNLNDDEYDINMVSSTFKGTRLNENITGTAINDNIDAGTGDDTINFSGLFGSDTIKVNAGERLTLNFEDVVDPEDPNEVEYSVDGKDVVITTAGGQVYIKDAAAKNTGADIFVNNVDLSTLPLFEFDEETAYQNKGAINGTSLADSIDVTDYQSVDGVKGVKITSGAGDDVIVGSKYNDVINAKSLEYQVADVTENSGTNRITTGQGDDVITLLGTSSNTVNAGTGDNVITASNNGVNRITAGNGDHQITLDGVYGQNTVRLGNAFGINPSTIQIDAGYNRVTTGKGPHAVDINGGINTVNTGAGVDTVDVSAGQSTVNTGAGNDTLTLHDGVNKINAGADNDLVNVQGGTNTVNMNAGMDTIIATAGTNNIRGGAGDDVFYSYGAGTHTLYGDAGSDTINLGYDENDNPQTSGTNIVYGGAGNDEFNVNEGTNFIYTGAGDDFVQIDGGINTIVDDGGSDRYWINNNIESLVDKKGNDTYNLSAYAGNQDINITDMAGKNVLAFDEKKNLFVDVTLGKKGKFTISNVITFEDIDGADHNLIYAGKDSKSIQGVVISDGLGFDTYKFDVSALAQEVADWMVANHYDVGASASSIIIAGGTDADALQALYAAGSAGCYQPIV